MDFLSKYPINVPDQKMEYARYKTFNTNYAKEHTF